MEKRRRLSDTRKGVVHKFNIAGVECYLRIGLFEDGSPGECFVVMAKEGSTLGGLTRSIGILTSMCLQYGVPTNVLREKFADMRFEPWDHESASIVDYMFRYLDENFPKQGVSQ